MSRGRGRLERNFESKCAVFAAPLYIYTHEDVRVVRRSEAIEER